MITARTPFSTAAVAGHYDSLDAFYRRLWGEHVHHGLWTIGCETPEEAALALAERVVRALGLRPGARAVDVGCGYGGTGRLLAARGVRVTGVTISEAQASYARAQPSPEGSEAPTYLVRDWLENGLPDGHFDAALAIESTTHMPDRDRVFAEIARVLRPGGRLVLCVWMVREAPSAWETRHLLEPICREGRLAGMGSAAENRAWIENAGLHMEAFEDWSGRVARTWTVCLARAARLVLADPEARRFLRDAEASDRAFALTLGRIRAAYALGAMRYGLFVARKPA